VPSIGPLEILVVAMIALIVFGPERLPDLARRVGRATAELRRMATEVREEFQAELDLDEEDEEPPERIVRRASDERRDPGPPEDERRDPGPPEDERRDPGPPDDSAEGTEREDPERRAGETE
jgi:sec-independent protein translocase protein TatB